MRIFFRRWFRGKNKWRKKCHQPASATWTKRHVTEGRLRPSRVVWQANECNERATTCSSKQRSKVNQSPSSGRSNGEIGSKGPGRDEEPSTCLPRSKMLETTKQTGDVDNGSMREVWEAAALLLCSPTKELWLRWSISHLAGSHKHERNNYSHPHELQNANRIHRINQNTNCSFRSKKVAHAEPTTQSGTCCSRSRHRRLRFRLCPGYGIGP